MTRGLHDIRLRYQDLANYSHMYLSWIPPGRGQSIIPSYFLWPEMGSYPDPNAGGSWPTLANSDGRVLPPNVQPSGPPGSVPCQSGQPAPVPPPVSNYPRPIIRRPRTTRHPQTPNLPPVTTVNPISQLALGAQGDPRGLAADAQGNLYVVTGAEAKVHKFSPAGQELTTWPVLGPDGQPAVEPFSIAVAGDHVLVLDAADLELATL